MTDKKLGAQIIIPKKSITSNEFSNLKYRFVISSWGPH